MGLNIFFPVGPIIMTFQRQFGGFFEGVKGTNDPTGIRSGPLRSSTFFVDDKSVETIILELEGCGATDDSCADDNSVWLGVEGGGGG